MVKGGPVVSACIFAEPSHSHKPLTQEHIWGKWLRRVVRAEMNKHYIQHREIGALASPDKTTRTLRAGDPTQSKLKIVCERCNSGWLSQIQERAKRYLIPIIAGERIALGKQAQEEIAAWCVMATMTGDFLHHDATAVAITQAERDWFRDNRVPPENWKVWIGRTTGRAQRWTHFVVGILDAKDIPTGVVEGLAPPNTQATNFVVGQLCVHVMSSTGSPETVAGWTWPFNSRIRRNLPQIWPPKEDLIAWPPQALTDFEVQVIATAFERVIEGASRSMLGRRLF